MKLHYYFETDSLYIGLGSAPSGETRVLGEGINIDLDDQGRIVGLDVDHASTRLDLTTLEAVGLPLGTLRAA